VVDPLRVDRADDVTHDAALAGGVHPLQHQQQPVGAAGATVREQPLLQVGQLVVALRAGPLAVGLAAVEAGGRRRVDVAEPEALAHREQLGHRARTRGHRVVAHGW
jgi:hypothetical protein